MKRALIAVALLAGCSQHQANLGCRIAVYPANNLGGDWTPAYESNANGSCSVMQHGDTVVIVRERRSVK